MTNRTNRFTYQSRFNAMLQTLRTEILTGVYASADYLPAENRLAERFHLSKNSIRQGLDALHKEGMIIRIPRVGTQIVKRTNASAIRLGVYPSLFEEAEIHALLAKFHERFPQIRVETIELPYNNPDSIRNLMKLEIVDALFINLMDYYHFCDTGQLHLFKNQKPRPGVHPFLNRIFEVGPDLAAALPFTFSPVILCYNKDIIREHRAFEPDSSWSWDDLKELLRKLKSPARYGMYFHLASFNRWILFLLQYGAKFAAADKKGMYPERHEMLYGLSMLRSLVHEEGLFPPALSLGENAAESLFLQRKVSVILTTYFRLNELKTADFEFDIAQLPHAGTARTLLLATAVAVNSKSAGQEAAGCLAEFLTSEYAQTHLRKRTYCLPADKKVSEAVSVEFDCLPSRLELHREIIPSYTTYRELHLTMRDILMLGEALKQYFSHLVDEEEMLELFNRYRLTRSSLGGLPIGM